MFFCFFLFSFRVPITLYSLTLKTGLDDIVCVLFRPKKKEKEKKIGIIIRILMWSSSCLFVFFEPDLWKLVIRREKQRCTGQLDNSLVSCVILLFFWLYSIISQNDLNYFETSKALPHHKQPWAGTGPSVVQCIYSLTVTLWSMNLHYKFLV